MKRILVAEDETLISSLIRRKLASAGYTVIIAADGNKALQLTLQDKPDLLLLDIVLPGREGLEVCREVKAALGDEAPPVILISGRGRQVDVQAGLKAGADDYIIKPFSPRLLLEHVQTALGD